MYAIYVNHPNKKYVLHQTNCKQYKKNVGRVPRWKGDTEWDERDSGFWTVDFNESELKSWFSTLKEVFPYYKGKPCSFCNTISMFYKIKKNHH